jgi:hypothetical protein
MGPSEGNQIVFEYSNYMNQGLNILDVSQLGHILNITFDQSGDVDVFDCGVGGFLWAEKAGKEFETRIRDYSNSKMGFRLASSEFGRINQGFGEDFK